jgi:hypothetical protein
MYEPVMIPKIPADISIPDPVLLIASIIALFFGCLFILLTCSRIKQLKLGHSVLYGLISLLSLSGAAIILLTALNIHSYQRLSYEAEVADIHFSRLGPGLYRAELDLAGTDDRQQFELRGDEWQLDARLIKWKAPLTIVGFNSLYRLDRLQGRYHDLEQERNAARTVYSLSRNSSLDLWSLIQRYRLWLPWLDAFYGSATYLPMADAASFQIKMSQSGLIARPINAAAMAAVGEWD